MAKATVRKATRRSPRTISAPKPRVGGKGVDIFRGIRAGDSRKKTQGVHQRRK